MDLNYLLVSWFFFLFTGCSGWRDVLVAKQPFFPRNWWCVLKNSSSTFIVFRVRCVAPFSPKVISSAWETVLCYVGYISKCPWRRLSPPCTHLLVCLITIRPHFLVPTSITILICHRTLHPAAVAALSQSVKFLHFSTAHRRRLDRKAGLERGNPRTSRAWRRI